MLREFTDVWAKYDYEDDMTIRLEDLVSLLDELYHPMGFKILQKKEIVEGSDADYELRGCMCQPPSIDGDDDDSYIKDLSYLEPYNSVQKQHEIDEMGIQSYENAGGARFRFRDVVFACVQRAYRKQLAKENPEVDLFKIDDRHADILKDETLSMKTVNIRPSHYMAALRIATAYRCHKFRDNLSKKVEEDPNVIAQRPEN